MARVLPMADATARQDAALLLAAGKTVAFATDTVYGLGGIPTSSAVRELYAIKGRPPTKPVPLLIANVSDLERYAPEPGAIARALVRAYWPGPLTVVLRARPEIALAVGAFDGTVGFRVPAHEDLRDLLTLCGGALAVTSANRSGGPEARSATEVKQLLGGQVDLVLDGGATGSASPSTVVGVRRDEIFMLRDGSLSEEVRSFAEAQGVAVLSAATVEANRP